MNHSLDLKLLAQTPSRTYLAAASPKIACILEGIDEAFR